MFLSILIIYCYVTNHAKTYLNQPQFITSPNSVGGLSSSAGPTCKFVFVAVVRWWLSRNGCSRGSVMPGFSTHVVFHAGSSQHGNLGAPRRPAAARPLMPEARRTHSVPSAAFCWSNQDRGPVQFQGTAKSHCEKNVNPVTEGITVPFFGPTIYYTLVQVLTYLGFLTLLLFGFIPREQKNGHCCL